MFIVTAVALMPMDKSRAFVSADYRSGSGAHIVLASNSISEVNLETSDLKFIKRYSQEYGVDYRLILALIKQESRFDKDAVSGRGAIGLMQLMPVTNAEILDELQIEQTSLASHHLRAGIYYYAKLMELFQNASDEDRLSLALAAYNAGPSRIYDAQELAAYMGENPNSWESVRNVLPLLSKRYYSLHQSVWGEEKPKNGYFGSYKQTMTFVDNIMTTYREFKQEEN